MTNFEYYIASGKATEGWLMFIRNNRMTIKDYNNWLKSEYKEIILDDIEKEYLSNIIKPFRKRVSSITKVKEVAFGSLSNVSYYIDIQLDGGDDYCLLPSFKPNTGMYKNMEADRKYTLKELGL
jgi:hypothetical protein